MNQALNRELKTLRLMIREMDRKLIKFKLKVQSVLMTKYISEVRNLQNLKIRFIDCFEI
jgi:hypothetical protein